MTHLSQDDRTIISDHMSLTLIIPLPPSVFATFCVLHEALRLEHLDLDVLKLYNLRTFEYC